jgi:hypothetical protein
VRHKKTGFRFWQQSAILLFAGIVGIAIMPIQQASASPLPKGSATLRLLTSKLDEKLVELFAESHGLPLSAVAGMRAGSLRTARAGNVEWAYARFVPSRTADIARFQDGGDSGVFEQKSGTWLTAHASIANGCASGLPSAIVNAWGLNKPSLCGAGPSGRRSSPAPDTAAIARDISGIAAIAASQVGVTDNPPTNSFADESADCDPYTAIEGVGAPACGADSTVINPNGTTTTVQNEGEYWCADFAKWVWSWAGQPDTGVLNPGADSFYTWGHDQGETLTTNGTNPQVGDAVVLYGQLDNGASPGLNVVADHVGIITRVYPNGYVDTVNGDFQGTNVIGVYQWTDMSLSTYASDAEGSGEMWVLVSPTSAESLSGTPAPASDNLINAFAMSSNGHLYQSYEKSDGSFDGWAAIAGDFPGGTLQGSIAALPAPASDKLINVFAMSGNGQLYQSYEKSNGSFTDWAAIAGSFPGGFLEGSISALAAPASDNLINVFAMGSNGQLYQSYEKSNGSFTDWAAVAGSFPGGLLQGSISALAAPASDNLINVFALGSDDHLYQSYEKSNGSFTGWAAVAGSFPGGSLQGSISALAAPASSNLINVFAIGSSGHLYQSYEKSNGSFTDWAAIAGSYPGGSLQGSISALAAPASDNLINVFALGSNSRFYQSYEKTSGSFTDWAAIAGTLPT